MKHTADTQKIDWTPFALQNAHLEQVTCVNLCSREETYINWIFLPLTDCQIKGGGGGGLPRHASWHRNPNPEFVDRTKAGALCYNEAGKGRSCAASIYLYFSNYFTDNRVTRARNGDHTRQRVAQDFPTSALRAIVERSRHARNWSPIDMKELERSLYKWSITDISPVAFYNFLVLLACLEIGFQLIDIPHRDRFRVLSSIKQKVYIK